MDANVSLFKDFKHYSPAININLTLTTISPLHAMQAVFQMEPDQMVQEV